MFNDCMEWVNSVMGWLSPRLVRSKDLFSFNSAIGHQKGLAGCEIIKDFPYSRLTDTSIHTLLFMLVSVLFESEVL